MNNVHFVEPFVFHLHLLIPPIALFLHRLKQTI